MLITVGIPFYNNQTTLAGAIRSVFAQTYQNWELLLVDDGSSDASVEIAKSIQDIRVRVITDGQNRGLGWRLNQIAQSAKGEYLARMDGDDLMHPQRLEFQLKYLTQNPGVDIVATGVYSLNQDNQIQGIRGLEDLTEMSTKKVLLNKGLIIHPTVMATREWFRRYPYDISYPRTQDRELWCRVANTSCFAKIAKPFYFYRESLINPQKYLKTYWLSSRLNWRLLQTYGMANLGLLGTLKQMGTIPVKMLAYQGLTWLGKQDLLLRQRNDTLNLKEQQEAEIVLNHILTYPVPGL